MRLRRRRRFPKVVLILLLAGMFLAGISVLELNLRATLITISRYKVTEFASEIVSEVIRKKVSPQVKYEDLVSSRTDVQGRVSFLQYNMGEMNRVTAEATLAIQDSLKKMDGKEIRIPLGQAFGSHLFASYGPVIKVLVSPVGSVVVNLKDRFEEAGINQTRHTIYLVAQTDVQMVVPLMDATTRVITEVPLTQVIIVGDVPQGVFWLPEQPRPALPGP